MKKLLIAFGVLVLIGVVSLVGLGLSWWHADPRPEPFAPDPLSERTLAQGVVRGFDTEAGAQGWLGIPYAAPPVGDRRWRAPQSAPGWDDVRDTLEAGPPCPQLGGPLSDVPRSDYGEVVGSEDCLTLNIWAPRHSNDEVDALDAPYPVMVWIHGGGNSVGYGADYDGSRLAADQRVIVVTLNYRLGVLGWFNHPAVVTDARGAEEASGNFALLDLIAALRWVRENIGAFGGDPERATVFGESAGGLNIYGLLASPLAQDLFHGAIVQSGLARGTSPELATTLHAEGGHPASAGELLSRWLVEQGRAPDRAAADVLQQTMEPAAVRAFLAGLDATALIDGFSAPGGMYLVPTLLEDGHVLPDRPLLEALADPDTGASVPVIAGTNRDEWKLFMVLDGRYVENRWGFMLRVRDPETYDAVASLMSDQWRLLGVDQPLDALVASGNDSVWGYRFDWDETGTGAVADMPELTGAAHGFELPFVFGDFGDFWGLPLMFPEEGTATRQDLSRAIRDYWANFAHRGEPGTGRGGAQPDWPRWGDGGEAGRVLVLDTPAGGGIRPADQRIDILALHQRYLDLRDRLAPPVSCGLYAYLFWDTPAWSAERYAEASPSCAERSPEDRAVEPPFSL